MRGWYYPGRFFVKVIPVTGYSGSGKTTFICSLIPLLARYGPVGTVKHTGHHSMVIPEGKDTTVMFQAGALAVTGIDEEKTLITTRSTSLTGALDILAMEGVAIVIVEGYKGSPIPKIIIGDLEAEGCVLRDPAPEDVTAVLDRFPDYISREELLRALATGCRGRGKPCSLASASVSLAALPGEEPLSQVEKELPALVSRMEKLPGVAAARAEIRRAALFGGPDEILVAVAAGTAEEAAGALGAALSRCREVLENLNPPGS